MKQLSDKAILAKGTLTNVEVEDSVYIDGTNKTHSFYRSGLLLDRDKISLYNSKSTIWQKLQKRLPSKWKIKSKNSSKK